MGFTSTSNGIVPFSDHCERARLHRRYSDDRDFSRSDWSKLLLHLDIVKKSDKCIYPLSASGEENTHTDVVRTIRFGSWFLPLCFHNASFPCRISRKTNERKKRIKRISVVVPTSSSASSCAAGTDEQIWVKCSHKKGEHFLTLVHRQVTYLF